MKLIDISMATNDDNGNFSHNVTRIIISDLVLTLDNDEGMACEFVSKGNLSLGDKVFPFSNHVSFYGSIVFEGFWFDTAQVAEILNHLQNAGGWTCEEAATPIWGKWHNKEIFTAQDILEVLI